MNQRAWELEWTEKQRPWDRFEILALLQPVLSGLGQSLSLSEPKLSGWQD